MGLFYGFLVNFFFLQNVDKNIFRDGFKPNFGVFFFLVAWERGTPENCSVKRPNTLLHRPTAIFLDYN